VASFQPKADTHVTRSRAGLDYSNVRIKCGDRAILFDPDHVPDLINQLERAHDEAQATKSRLVKERSYGE